MVPEDLPEVIRFWQEMEGIGLSESDSVPTLTSYLQRNPELSFVARNEQRQVIGAVLCGPGVYCLFAIRQRERGRPLIKGEQGGRKIPP